MKRKSLLLLLLALLPYAGWAENYEIETTPSVVTATPSIVIEDGSAEETIASYDGQEVNATIKGRKLNGKAWNVMVLPFDLDPFDFMIALGKNVCVYNVLESIESATVTEVKFRMTTDIIPANTPFIVMPNKDFNADMTFKKVIIKGDAPTQVCTAGKFIGTYKTREVGETAYYALQGGEFKKFVTPTVKIGFTRAYITLDISNEVRFYIEEEDGTITAISFVEPELDNQDSEGWYTVDGKKMNATPTQKGMYIHQGRKVVIK